MSFSFYLDCPLSEPRTMAQVLERVADLELRMKRAETNIDELRRHQASSCLNISGPGLRRFRWNEDVFLVASEVIRLIRFSTYFTCSNIISCVEPQMFF